MSELVTPVIIYSLVLIFCLTLIKRINKERFDFFDPGFLFLIFVTLTFLPLSILVILGLDLINFNANLSLIDLTLYGKTIIAHAILIASFTAGYCFFGRGTRQTEYFSVSKVWYSKTFVLVSFFLILFHTFAVKFLFPGGVYRYIFFIVGLMKEASEIIALGVIASQFKAKRMAIISIIFVGFFILFVPNIIFPQDGVIVMNRGRAFILTLGAACYVDMVKWKGQLFNGKIFISFAVMGLSGLAIANIFEGVMSGDTVPSFTELGIAIATSLEPLIFDNAATLISWIDQGQIDLKVGRTYLEALQGFTPFWHKYESLSVWYVWERNPMYAMSGGGYAFSAVAEGYLNGKFFGVVIHGLLLSIIAVTIRYIKHSKLLGIYRPFFYSSAILLVYGLNRRDMMGNLGSIEFLFVGVVCLLIIFSIINEGTLKSKYMLNQYN